MEEQGAANDQTVSQADMGRLTLRQVDCLQRAGKGLSSKEIGRELGISPSTVDNHIQAAVTKLRAKNRWHAAQLLDVEIIQNGEDESCAPCLVPPLGGARNRYSSRTRLVHILTIAAAVAIVVSTLIIFVSGALHVFGPE